MCVWPLSQNVISGSDEICVCGRVCVLDAPMLPGGDLVVLKEVM